MARLPFVLVAVGIALLVCSCVTTQTDDYSGVTGSDEEFRLKYPGLGLQYFDDIVEVESLAAKGRRLYDRYYKLKDEQNKIDDETRRHAVETFSRAVNATMRIYKETGAYSVLRLQRDVSTCMQDLLREYEKPAPAPGLPK